MSDDVIEQLAEFIEKYEACDAYSVTWYGGEPLMAFEQMKKMAKRFKSIKDKKWNGHMIVSNTSLLNGEMIDFSRSIIWKAYRCRLTVQRSITTRLVCLRAQKKEVFNYC